MQKNFIRNTICMTAIVMSMVMTAACGTPTSSSEIASSAPSVQSVANLPAAVTESKAVVVSAPSTQASTAAKSASVAVQATTKSYAESTSSVDAVTETADTTEEAAEDAADAGSSDDNSVVEDAGEAQVNEEPANDSISQSGHYVLNKSTKKFHYAGCASAKQIKASNYAEFDGDRDTLISRGYSACKKCNP
ncbi:MAG: hypothetical protein MRZ64_08365 [[Bacteroides] pectinophilus]|nr:hypothetical protein [[Bacteroides] pectinophilus]